MLVMTQLLLQGGVRKISEVAVGEYRMPVEGDDKVKNGKGAGEIMEGGDDSTVASTFKQSAPDVFWKPYLNIDVLAAPLYCTIEIIKIKLRIIHWKFAILSHTSCREDNG